MGVSDRNDAWLETEDAWRRWQVAALLVGLVFVVVRFLVLDPAQRTPTWLVTVGVALAVVGLVLGMWALGSEQQGSWGPRDPWRGRSRADRREALTSLRTGRPVRDDLLEPAVESARQRVVVARGVGWIPLLLVTPVMRPPTGWSSLLAVGAVGLGFLAWRRRVQGVAEYRTVRAQQDGSAQPAQGAPG